MTNQTSKIQVNIKTSDRQDAALINVYAETGQELDGLLQEVIRLSPLIAQAKGAVSVGASGLVQSAAVVNTQPQQGQEPPQTRPLTPYEQPQAAPAPQWSQQPPQQQFSQPATQGPVCQHGPMTHRSGSKNGRDWSGYFCPTPKGTPGQCDPVFGK